MSSRKPLFIGASIVGIALLWLFWPSGIKKPSVESVNVPSQARRTNQAATTAPPTQAISPPKSSRLENLVGSLRASQNAQDNFRSLKELAAALDQLPPREASAEVLSFLDSKTDAPTQLPFKLGPGGVLTTAPTLRVFLLDYLRKVDPQGAADYAMKIVESMDSADEWAVALRNYAQVNQTSEGKAFLESKFKSMLSYEPWARDPSTGYLEAFDIPVSLGGTNFVAGLAQLVTRKDNPAVAHAGYLSLDRLVISNPAETLRVLESDPDLMKGRELTRANYFARADLRDQRQRAVIEKYLLNESLGAEELNQFVGLFPNGNYMVSNNLLTQVNTPTGNEIANRDAAAMRVVEDWMKDPRFQKLTPQLEKMRERLQKFVHN